jgi:tellurite resistance-related uncharacterized protein
MTSAEQGNLPADLPAGVVPYRTIGPFDESTLPKGLLSDHRTRAGVWGLVEVSSGSVRYVVCEPGKEREQVLAPGYPGVIVPEQRHHLALDGAVQFTVTFLRAETA